MWDTTEPAPDSCGTGRMRRVGLPLRHARDAFGIYLGVRVVLSVATVALQRDASHGRPWLDLPTMVWCVGVSLLLSEADLRRAGAPELLYNLGVGRRERMLLAALPMLLAETLLHVVAR